MWKWRNNERHDEQFVRPFNLVKTTQQYAEEVALASATRTLDNRKIGSLEVCWIPPREGWVKLNTDGAVQGENKIAGYGGLLRDADG